MPTRFPKIFLAISYDAKEKWLRDWFRKFLRELDFEVIEGDYPKPTPPQDKVPELIDQSDCVLFVFTRFTKIEDKEEWKPPDWLQQELGMTYRRKPLGIVIENGVTVEGITSSIASYENFNRDSLINDVPRILRYLIELRNELLGQPDLFSENVIAITRGLINELGGHIDHISIEGSIPLIKLSLSYYSATISGRIFNLPVDISTKIMETYELIHQYYDYVNKISSQGKVFTLNRSVPEDKKEEFEIKRKEIILQMFDEYMSLSLFISPELKDELKQLWADSKSLES